MTRGRSNALLTRVDVERFIRSCFEDIKPVETSQYQGSRHWLTVEELRYHFRLSDKRLRKLRKEGLPHINSQGTRRKFFYDVEEVERWLIKNGYAYSLRNVDLGDKS